MAYKVQWSSDIANIVISGGGAGMVLNANFNNISVISWWSVLLVVCIFGRWNILYSYAFTTTDDKVNQKYKRPNLFSNRQHLHNIDLNHIHVFQLQRSIWFCFVFVYIIIKEIWTFIQRTLTYDRFIFIYYFLEYSNISNMTLYIFNMLIRCTCV
jgi:hypothetical protein